MDVARISGDRHFWVTMLPTLRACYVRGIKCGKSLYPPGNRDVTALINHSAITLSPFAVESHPTPGDSRGSSSPSRSISGISSHGADGGSARIPHECVQPSLSRSSSPSRSIHSPEHHVIFHPSCSHHVPKVA